MLSIRCFRLLQRLLREALFFLERCNLTPTIVLSTEVANQMLLIREAEGGWSRSWRDCSRRFGSDVPKIFATHCSSEMSTLKCHFLDHLVSDLEILGSLSLMDEERFEHFNVLIKNSYRKRVAFDKNA